VNSKWKPGLRTAAILTALVVPGGLVALLAVALVRRSAQSAPRRQASDALQPGTIVRESTFQRITDRIESALGGAK